MRHLPMLSTAALLLLAACGPSTQSNPANNPLAGAVWTAETISGEPVLAATPATLELTQDGQVSGQSGCNGYFGSATLDGERISFNQLASTNMACPEPQMQQEGRYHAALAEVQTYSLDGDTLSLLDGSGATVIRYTR